MRTFIAAAVVAGALVATPAWAQTRAELVDQIMKAQGLQTQLEAAVEQSRQAARQMGQNAFQQMMRQVGEIPADKRPKIEAIVARYNDAATNLWKTDELVGLWKQSYGKDLTDADLKAILAYYKWPVGAKDVASRHSTMQAFTAKFSEQSQARLKTALQKMADDLKAEVGPVAAKAPEGGAPKAPAGK